MDARSRPIARPAALTSLLVIAIAVLSSTPSPVAADPGSPLYVAPGAACGAATPCFSTIQAAVDAASPGDLIKVAAGTYAGVSSRDSVTQLVYISKTVSIAGGYTSSSWTTADPAANPTTLNAALQGRVIYITGAITPTLEGLRITGGDARGLQGGSPGGEDVGGGVLANFATVTIDDCRIYGNVADDGAGISLGLSNAVITASAIYSNVAGARNGGSGGGISVYGSVVTLVNNVIVSNTAVYSETSGPGGRGGDGGGVQFLESTPDVRGNLFSGNIAEWGAGLSAENGGGGRINGNQFISNTATWSAAGLGVRSWDDSTVTGNTFSDNTADTDGGGMWIQNSVITVSQNTVVGNRALGGSAGGIRMDGPAGSTVSGNMVLSNTAYWSGAGIFVNGDSLVSGNVVKYNQGNDGAGIQTNGNPRLFDNVVSYNEAGWHGGGIKVSSGSAWISNTIVTHNAGGWDSGGIRVEGVATLVNPVIVANTLISGNDGAGIWMQGAQVTLLHPTIAGNVGSSGGSHGIYVKYVPSPPTQSTLTVTNAIFANQSQGGIWAELNNSVVLNGILCFNSNGGACGGGSGSYSIVGPWWDTGDPFFEADGYHVMDGSFAINQGVAAGITTDIDGQPRTSGAPDLGADEQGTPVPPTGGTVFPSPGVTVTAPAGAFTGTVVIRYQDQPITFTGALTNVGVFYDLSATFLSGVPASLQPGQHYTITVSYRQQDVPAGVNEADLALYYWSGSAWAKEPTSVVNVVANTITASPDHFSLWGVLGPPGYRVYLPLAVRSY